MKLVIQYDIANHVLVTNESCGLKSFRKHISSSYNLLFNQHKMTVKICESEMNTYMIPLINSIINIFSLAKLINLLDNFQNDNISDAVCLKCMKQLFSIHGILSVGVIFASLIVWDNFIIVFIFIQVLPSGIFFTMTLLLYDQPFVTLMLSLYMGEYSVYLDAVLPLDMSYKHKYSQLVALVLIFQNVLSCIAFIVNLIVL